MYGGRWVEVDDKVETLDVDSQITFANITPAMNVWNNVPISLEVSDDKGIATVEAGDDQILSPWAEVAGKGSMKQLNMDFR